jgi:hypothetical protein
VGEFDDDLRTRAGVGGQDATRAHVGDAPVVVERAHGADDAEARFSAAGKLHRERRADPDPQRLREPDADLRLIVAVQPPSAVDGRVLEPRVVAGEGEQLHRLAERERVGALDDVARGGVGHARQRAHGGGAIGGQPRRQLVALADRAGVVAQRGHERPQAEHQQHDGAAHRQDRDGRRGAAAARQRQPRPERGEAAAQADALRARKLRAAQEGHGRARGRPPGGPCRRARDDAHDDRERRRQRPQQHPARRLLVEGLEQLGRGPAHRERAARHAQRAGQRAAAAGAPRVLRRDPRAREADRSLHADGRQPALHVSRGRRREHRRGRAQRDEREGDEQCDDDARRRVDEHAHAAARDEAHSLDLRARGAGLLEQDVDVMRVGGPDKRLVDGHLLAALACDPRARDVDARGGRQGEGDVVGSHRDARNAQRPQPPDLDLVADAHVPRVGHASLDDRLVGAAVDVAPCDDRVAAAAPVDELDGALLG